MTILDGYNKACGTPPINAQSVIQCWSGQMQYENLNRELSILQSADKFLPALVLHQSLTPMFPNACFLHRPARYCSGFSKVEKLRPRALRVQLIRRWRGLGFCWIDAVVPTLRMFLLARRQVVAGTPSVPCLSMITLSEYSKTCGMFCGRHQSV